MTEKYKISAFWQALIVVVLSITVLELWSRSAVNSMPHKITSENMSLLAHEKDDHGNLTKKHFLNLQRPREVQSKNVIVIGGSTLREGLLKDFAIQRDYIDSTDPLLDFTSLYSFDQSLAETARIALAQKIQSGDVVVINLNPRRLGFSQETLSKELSFSRVSLLPEEALTPVIDQLRPQWPEIKKPAKVSVSILDHRLFTKQWLKGRLPAKTKQSWVSLSKMNFKAVEFNQLFNLKPRKVRRYLRYAYGTKALSDEKKQVIADTVATTRVPEYEANSEFGFALLESLTLTLNGRGAEVIFLDLPRTNLSREAYGPVWQDYNAKLDAIVSRTENHRIDLRQVPIPQEHFYDLEHVMQPSRPLLSEALIDALKQGGWIKS